LFDVWNSSASYINSKSHPPIPDPRVNNDNAFAESLFRTTKYHLSYPLKSFTSLHEARRWTENFVSYYKTEHKYRPLNFITPEQKHLNQDIKLLQKRRKKLEQKRTQHPTRLDPEQSYNGNETFLQRLENGIKKQIHLRKYS